MQRFAAYRGVCNYNYGTFHYPKLKDAAADLGLEFPIRKSDAFSDALVNLWFWEHMERNQLGRHSSLLPKPTLNDLEKSVGRSDASRFFGMFETESSQVGSVRFSVTPSAWRLNNETISYGKFHLFGGADFFRFIIRFTDEVVPTRLPIAPARKPKRFNSPAV